MKQYISCAALEKEEVGYEPRNLEQSDSRFLEQLSIDSKDEKGITALHKDMHFASTFKELEN